MIVLMVDIEPLVEAERILTHVLNEVYPSSGVSQELLNGYMEILIEYDILEKNDIIWLAKRGDAIMYLLKESNVEPSDSRIILYLKYFMKQHSSTSPQSQSLPQQHN